MRSGAGLRVTLRDEEGKPLSGQYEFYDDSESRVRLVLLVSDRWKPGSDAWATTSRIHPYGTHESSGPIPLDATGSCSSRRAMRTEACRSSFARESTKTST